MRDWFDNLNVGQRAREKGDSGAYWHKGWMRQARILYAFALLHKPKFIVGHSLGAAIAQIVGASLNIPTLCFASPRPYWGWKKVLHWEVVQNIIRKDDRVCYLPFKPKGLLKLVVGPWQFRHVGWVTTLTPAKPNPVVHHFE